MTTRPMPDLERLRRLSPAKYALLMRTLREREARASVEREADEAAGSAGRPLSFGQERLWFLDQLTPGSAAYNMPYAVRLSGTLDPAAVGRAFGAVVQRHETLRSTYPAVDGSPRQVVAEASDVPVPVTDLRGLPAAERETEAARLAAEHAATPFDLGAGPLLRVGLLRLADEEWVALLNLHHIVCDDWSIGVLMQEFALAFSTGDPLPPLRVQYGEYARRQRERHGRDGALSRELEYWTDRLAGELPNLTLPTDRPRPSVQTYHGARIAAPVPAPLAGRLRELARENGATLFMVLLAAYGVLLYRYSRQSEVVVGTSSASRHRPETEPLVGFLVNTLPLRLECSGEATFGELVAEVKQRVLAAFAHQDVPFERIVEKIQPERDPSRSPLFQTMFNLHNAQREELRLPGLRATRFGAEQDVSAMFDLTLDVSDDGAGGLVCEWEYNTDLFDPATVDRLAGHFERLLTAVTAGPELLLAEVPLLSDAERHALLTAANEVSVAVRPDERVHRLFEEHARRTPDAVAVVDGDRHTTYGELEHGAELIARRLRAMGVGPEVRVGLCGPRSADTIAALLGVLKAGGAYVPLDPSNPVDRLNFVMADAEVKVLLVNRATAEAVPELGAAVTVAHHDVWLADGEAGLTGTEPTSGPEPVADNLAFIVYTSGSTGRAKGGMITHGALLSAFRSWERVYGLGTVVHRHLQAANLAFDVFTGDLVRALCSGGSLVLCSREVLLDPAKLFKLLQDERIDFADLVPVVVRLLARHVADQGKLLDNFKVFAVGADIWFMKDYWALHALCPPGTRLVNSYGITESTVDSGLFETPMPERGLEEPVPIGRPLPNTEFYVLDDRMQPVPTGVNGTLYIGGLALARGYVARPGLTAERFLPHPFSAAPGARLYNTGDLARVLPTGDVEVLGRIDRQIKIRGFRIELEEIEAVLGKHPDVQDTAVVVRLDERGEKRLAGYAVARSGRSLDAGVLTEHLRAQLPYYMVPTTLTVLDRMPLNSNGKHDRKALPAPVERAAPSRTGTPLVDPVELRIAEIWKSVLGVDEITAEDDFFELGGHSLLVPRVAFELRDRLGADVPLVGLFEATTVGTLARLVAGAGPSLAPARSPVLDTVLDTSVRVEPDARRTLPERPRKVLLTGATGFLGAHLLGTLLRETDADVHCLVRADGAGAGLERMRNAMAEYGVDESAELHEKRVVIVPGDLAAPMLGLSEAAFDLLAEGLDAVYHSGARVNFLLPFADLAPANVRGTEEVLRLAARADGARVHHVSTAAVPAATAEGDKDTAAALQGGYNQSKWVAERFAAQARERGVPVAVHRPDYIGGHGVSGRGNPKDLIWAMIKGSIQLGAYPDVPLPVRMVPVDLVAQTLVRVSLGGDDGGAGRAYDFAHPAPVSLDQLFAWVRDFGYDLRPLPYDGWLAELRTATEKSWDNALHPFLTTLTGPMDQDPATAPGAARTENAYDAAGLPCPPTGEPLVRAYLAHLVHSGFLPAPAHGGERNEEKA